MKRSVRHTSILLLLAFISCQKEDADRAVMSFGTDEEVYTWTKADALNSKIEISTMKVWASRKEGESLSTLMEGYAVNYSSSEGWRYDNIQGQGLQFWDNGAAAFRFHAGAPASAVNSITADGLQLSITSSSVLSQTALFSSPKVVLNGSEDFGKTVPLTFNQGNSRVSVAFINSSSSAKTITDLSFTPVASYIGSATLNVGYDWGTSPAIVNLSVSDTSQVRTPLQFNGLSNIQAGESNPVFSETNWYMAPESTADESSSSQWIISFKDGGSPRSATFNQGKKWRPGYSYKYVFTIKDDGLSLELITINDWNTQDLYVTTEQISSNLKLEVLSWGQDVEYIHSYEFVNLYQESTNKVLWAACNLGCIFNADVSKTYAWAQIAPESDTDEDYLSKYFNNNTGFKWQTPSRADFTALMDETNTVRTIVKDEESKVLGLVIKAGSTTKSIFLPCTDMVEIESVFEETKTKITRTYRGSYWTKDSIDADNVYKFVFSFVQIEIRTPDGAGGYISNFSDYKSFSFTFVSLAKTEKLPVRALLKISE